MPENRKKNSVMVILAIVAVAVALSVGRWWLPASGPTTLLTEQFMVMGTFAQIRLHCRDKKTGLNALAAAKAAINHVDQLMSTYRPDSQLSAVNRDAADRPVNVSRETFDLLTRSIEYSRLSQGGFDITVPPLIQLWKQAAKNDQEPNQQQLAATLESVGYENLELIEDADGTLSVRFDQPGMSLDVGAIAKGYAVDVALQATRLPGIPAALVDIGGEIACFGPGRDQDGWRVGVQNPFAPDTDNQLIQSARWILRLDNCAVATSGNYRRYVTVAGRKFSHIIDPHTGRPAAKLPSVTVIAPNATDADALATVISVIGPEKGLALVESLDGVEALLVAGNAAQSREIRSSGFHAYEVQP